MEYRIWQNLVRETAEFGNEHADQFRGVTFVDGFRNTIPWPASSQEPPRIGALSAHPYPVRKVFPKDEPEGLALNALFVNDEGPKFSPTCSVLFPEYYAAALQTETVIRDMGPITTPIYGTLHGRNARVIDGKIVPCPMWFTEIGIHPEEHGVADRESAMSLKAKVTARDACFFPAKGVERIYFFAAHGGDTGYGLVSDHFFEHVRTAKQYPIDETDFVSPALRTLKNIAAKMRVAVDPNLTQTRQISLASITDEHDHYQFQGDGTPQHPNLFNRDLYVFLPFQANRNRFVIPYYVMTHDVTQNFKPEDYTIEILGINGHGAMVTAYDPIEDRDVPLEVKTATKDKLILSIKASDYPYLLTIQEQESGTTKQ